MICQKFFLAYHFLKFIKIVTLYKKFSRQGAYLAASEVLLCKTLERRACFVHFVIFAHLLQYL